MVFLLNAMHSFSVHYWNLIHNSRGLGFRIPYREHFRVWIPMCKELACYFVNFCAWNLQYMYSQTC
jgi:hypothetical protein